MTWALSKVSHFLAVCYSLRISLKLLKKISNTKYESSADYGNNKRLANSVLMFWSIYGIMLIYELFFEFFLRWFPGYYYFKTLFIILIAVPEIKITNLIFFDVLVPTIEFCYRNLLGDEKPSLSASDFISSIPMFILVIIFPMLHEEPNYDKSHQSGTTNFELTDIYSAQSTDEYSSDFLQSNNISSDLITVTQKSANNSIPADKSDFMINNNPLLDNSNSTAVSLSLTPLPLLIPNLHYPINSISSPLSPNTATTTTASPPTTRQNSLRKSTSSHYNDNEYKIQKVLDTSRRLSQLAHCHQQSIHLLQQEQHQHPSEYSEQLTDIDNNYSCYPSDSTGNLTFALEREHEGDREEVVLQGRYSDGALLPQGTQTPSRHFAAESAPNQTPSLNQSKNQITVPGITSPSPSFAATPSSSIPATNPQTNTSQSQSLETPRKSGLKNRILNGVRSLLSGDSSVPVRSALDLRTPPANSRQRETERKKLRDRLGLSSTTGGDSKMSLHLVSPCPTATTTAATTTAAATATTSLSGKNKIKDSLPITSTSTDTLGRRTSRKGSATSAVGSSFPATAAFYRAPEISKLPENVKSKSSRRLPVAQKENSKK